MNELIKDLMKNHRTRRVIKPLTLALETHIHMLARRQKHG